MLANNNLVAKKPGKKLQKLHKIIFRDVGDITEIIGVLNFKKVQYIYLPVINAIEQLKNLDDISFSVGIKCGADYFDRLIATYKIGIEKFSLLSSPHIITTDFYLTLQKTFKNPANESKLRKLGATDTDFALINNDLPAIEKAAKNNEKLNIYQLATKFRFLNLVKSMYIKKQYSITNEPYYYNEFTADDIKIQLNNQPEFLLKELHNQIFVTSNIVSNKIKTLAITIYDIGNLAWNSKTCSLAYKNMLSYFDKIVAYGTGENNISLNYVSSLVNNLSLEHQDLDFAMIMLYIHGKQAGDDKLKEVLIAFPDNFAKKTVYYLESCFSGQYHKYWNKDAIFITSSNQNEASYPIDNFWWNHNFNSSLKLSNDPIDIILEYCYKFTESTPYISGKINEEIYTNYSAPALYDKLHPSSILGEILDYVSIFI